MITGKVGVIIVYFCQAYFCHNCSKYPVHAMLYLLCIQPRAQKKKESLLKGYVQIHADFDLNLERYL